MRRDREQCACSSDALRREIEANIPRIFLLTGINVGITLLKIDCRGFDALLELDAL
jgi:hypothetical protein